MGFVANELELLQVFRAQLCKLRVDAGETLEYICDLAFQDVGHAVSL